MSELLPFLNVVTPVTRPGNLQTIYANLAKVSGLKIRWYTIFEPLYAEAAADWSAFINGPTRKSKAAGNPLEVEIAVSGKNGGWGGSKRSYAISIIRDGWCYFLDDDNLMHDDLTKVFLRGVSERPDADVIVFHQIRVDGKLRLEAGPERMKTCHFDTGQFVIKRSFIGVADYAPTDSPWSTIWPETGTGDWSFIKKFWEASPERFHFVPEVGAYYNALR